MNHFDDKRKANIISYKSKNLNLRYIVKSLVNELACFGVSYEHVQDSNPFLSYYNYQNAKKK